jgi:oligopeptide transport system permease protein
LLGSPVFPPMARARVADPQACDEAPIGNGPFKMDGRWEHDRGWIDAVISRVTEVFAALPTLLGVLVFLTLVRTHSVASMVTALALVGWPPVARIARGAAISTRHFGYVRTARALGASNTHIAVRHILADVISPIAVVASSSLAGYIAAEGTLSYLGVGLRPPAISWGILINQAQHLASVHSYLLLFPCGFLLIPVVCLILLSDPHR